VKDHVLLPYASQLSEVKEEYVALLSPKVLRSVVDLIPEDWLNIENGTPAEIREIYFQFLSKRLSVAENLVKEAQNARQALI
jgi:hypothetical protein